MSSALLVGSFDPPTYGHLNLVERGAKLFSKLFVGVGKNTQKQNLLSIEERVTFLKRACKHFENVEVIEIKGLTASFAHENGINFLLRGIRFQSDLDFELQLAAANRELTGVETLLLPCDPKFSYQSSSLIKEIALEGHSLERFVPTEVDELIRGKIWH